jgi:hypothetical protein
MGYLQRTWTNSFQATLKTFDPSVEHSRDKPLEKVCSTILDSSTVISEFVEILLVDMFPVKLPFERERAIC